MLIMHGHKTRQDKIQLSQPAMPVPLWCTSSAQQAQQLHSSLSLLQGQILASRPASRSRQTLHEMMLDN